MSERLKSRQAATRYRRDCHEMGSPLEPIGYSRLAAAIFAIVAVLQLVRALAGSPVTVARTEIPIWASWVAFVVAGLLAWVGFTVSHP